MDELTTRPATVGDAGALARLQSAIDEAFGGHSGVTEAEMRSMLTNWVRDPAQDVRVVITPSGEIVAAAYTVPPVPGGRRAATNGGVHPDWTGRGIGRQLLSWQLERVGQMHADADASATWILSSGSMVDNRAAGRLLARFGFEPVRYFMEMSAGLSAAPAGPVAMPDGLRMAAYQAHMADAVYEAHMDAFADHWGFERRPEEQWRGLTVQSDDFRPELSRVVFDGDQVAAYTLGYAGAGSTELHIGQVGTRRPWRRRGLAQLMLTDVMAAARAAGLKDAGLGVDADSPTGAPGVYARVGFEVTSRWVSYHRDLDQP